MRLSNKRLSHVNLLVALHRQHATMFSFWNCLFSSLRLILTDGFLSFNVILIYKSLYYFPLFPTTRDIQPSEFQLNLS
jgi:hypothetical protein